MATKTTKQDTPKQDPPADDPLISASEVARIIGKPISTVRRWIAEGAIRSVKVPSGIRQVRQSEAADWRQRLTVPADETMVDSL